ncbi:MAG: MYXO-CTERM sorting domain-containing protein [Polyangiaceae bacterium]
MIQAGRVRSLAAALVSAVILVLALLPSRAFAGGTIVLDKATLDETETGWKLKMTIELSAVPDINFVPMDFVFTPKVYYERTCDDTHDKPYLNKKPITNAQIISVPQTVGFSDGSGKTYKKTNYSFTIKRDDRFEAGEYQLEVQQDGKAVGSKMTITLNGNNKIVNRKAMVFSGDKSKKSADPCDDPSVGVAPAKVDPPVDTPAKDTSSSSSTGSGEPASSGSGSTDASGSTSGDPPGTVPPKQGGCGCVVANDGEIAGGALLTALGIAAFASRRRKRAA